MLWRLYHSSSLQTYLHDKSPYSIVLYDEYSDKLCAATCGKLLSQGSDLIIIAMNPGQRSNLRGHLQSVYPKKNIVAFDAHVENTEVAIQTLSGVVQSRNVTLFISFIDGSLGSTYSTNGLGLSTSVNSSVDLFVELQKLVLTQLKRNAPSALLLVANTLSLSLSDEAEFFKSFATGVSAHLQSSSDDKVQVTFMEYHDAEQTRSRNSILSPSPEVLSDSILRALGRDSAHVIPYWPHELLAWFVWCLLFIFPSSFVMKLAP